MVYYSGSSFTRYAMDKANEFGGFSNKATTKLHNDSYDAYRHALLSAKLTSYFGDNFAKDFLDDHEKDNPNPASETNMDKWNNNNIGRQEYHNWKSATEAGETSKSLDEWIYDKVKEGKTINDPTNDSRTWVEPENSSLPSSNGGWYDNGHQCLKPWAKDVNRNGKSYGYDPLILDLGGNGIETISVAGFSGSLFDHNNDGIRTATGWISADDGLLVRDLNGNGLIDNGSELFGNNTRLANGQNAAHGYAALAELDSNHDNLINQADELFSSLKVWQDINQDGISQANELFTLDALGIQSLNLEHQENSKDLGNGNRLTHIGSYTKIDGTTGEMGDVEFAANRLYSRYTDTVELTPEQLKAPNLQSLGRLRDLTNSFDISGSLKVD